MPEVRQPNYATSDDCESGHLPVCPLPTCPARYGPAEVQRLVDEGRHLVLDNYIVLDILGHGSFGCVKAGINVTNGEKVAIKILNRKKMRELNVVQKIRREIKLLARLDHPHVIKLQKVIVSPSDIFLVVEYAGGGELFNYITKNQTVPPVAESRRLFQQLISGLAHCHRLGIVHRDLKPENLLLDDDCNVKIADFGLSNIVADGQLMRTSCGSPNYAAPEVVLGRQYAGPEVDVWSAGVILYVLLTGRMPFDADSVEYLFRLIARGEFRMPRSVRPAAANLLKGMICVDTRERYTMRQVIDDPWFRVDLPDQLFADAHDPKPMYSCELSAAETTSAHSVTQLPTILPTDLVRLAVTVDAPLDVVAKKVINSSPDEIAALLAGSSRPKPPSTMSSSTCSSSCGSSTSETDGHQSRQAQRIVRPCLPKGLRFCAPDCRMCPTWGASECLFAKRITSLNACDTCPDAMRKGCIHSADPLSMEDMCAPSDARPQDRAVFKLALANHIMAPAAPHVFTEKTERLFDVLTAQKQAVRRQKWHLGIRSASQPHAIMHSLYSALKANNFEWQVINVHHLLLRRRADSIPNAPRINVELYQLPRGVYLIDFRNVEPPDTPKEDDRSLVDKVEGLARRRHTVDVTGQCQMDRDRLAAIVRRRASAPSAPVCDSSDSSSSQLTPRLDNGRMPTPSMLSLYGNSDETSSSSLSSIDTRHSSASAVSGCGDDWSLDDDDDDDDAQIVDKKTSTTLENIDEVGEVADELLGMTVGPPPTAIPPALRSLRVSAWQLTNWTEEPDDDDDDDDDDDQCPAVSTSQCPAASTSQCPAVSTDRQRRQPAPSHTLRFLDECAALITSVMNVQ